MRTIKQATKRTTDRQIYICPFVRLPRVGVSGQAVQMKKTRPKKREMPRFRLASPGERNCADSPVGGCASRSCMLSVDCGAALMDFRSRYARHRTDGRVQAIERPPQGRVVILPLWRDVRRNSSRYGDWLRFENERSLLGSSPDSVNCREVRIFIEKMLNGFALVSGGYPGKCDFIRFRSFTAG